MSDSEIDQIPAGFELLPTGLGFTDMIQPCYRRVEGDTLSMGLRVEQHHCNMMGFCHGGVLMTLADIAAASGVNLACGKKAGSPTLNLSLDFISPGRLGEWLEAEISPASIKRRFGFCNGVINNKAGVVARFNGMFYLPDHKGLWQVKQRVDGILGE